MNLSFRYETDRNTKCCSFKCGELRCYVSYQTIVAFEHGRTRLRLHNSWGPTTGRHMKEMGVHGWKEADTKEFEHELDLAFAKMVRDDVARVLASMEVEDVVG